MNRIWIVIYTVKGLIQEPLLFSDKEGAVQKMRWLKRTMNPDYDELDLFEKRIRV